MSATSPSPADLGQMLAAAALGDRRAFASIYDATGAKLFGLAVRICGRRDWAEDVVQDAFVSIWQHAGDYRAEKGSPLAWMGTIVRNRALDRRRRDKGDVPIDAAPGSPAWMDAGPSPLDSALASDDAKRIWACLETLEGQQKQAILLAYYEGSTHEELATKLLAPLGTVKSWVRRGLMRLKACLEP